MVETNGERLILNYIRVLQNTRKRKNYYHILGTSGPCFLKYIDLYCILHKYSVMYYFFKIFNLKIKIKLKIHVFFTASHLITPPVSYGKLKRVNYIFSLKILFNSEFST